MKLSWRIWRMGERMGLKYNETTGEFYEAPRMPKAQYDRLKGEFISATPQKTVGRPPRKTRRIVRPSHSHFNWIAVKLIIAPMKWLLYPFVKWWEVEKDAIDEQDWFMAVVWGVVGLVLIGLYRVFGPFVLFFLAKALDSVSYKLAQ